MRPNTYALPCAAAGRPFSRRAASNRTKGCCRSATNILRQNGVFGHFGAFVSTSASPTPTLSGFDALLGAADLALRTLFSPARSDRPWDANAAPMADALSAQEKSQVAALMRVNHTGEICAQALYSGQALATKNNSLRSHLAAAGTEEVDHLAWTEARLGQLGARGSLLNPLWYAGAFAIGYGAARLGDDWSLGFVAETEQQVEAHLQSHLGRLPAHDTTSRAILQQMQAEEARHRDEAVALGARVLPAPIQLAMRLAAKVMTSTAARI